MFDYIRIACAVPEIALGSPVKNAGEICRLMEQADQKGADLVLFPELRLTGCTCDDLFFRDDLWKEVRKGLILVGFQIQLLLLGLIVFIMWCRLIKT